MNDSNIEELNLNMCRTSQYNKVFVCAAALLLTCGLFLAAPVRAHATQVITSIDSTMTITMQRSSDDGFMDEDASGDGSATGDSTSGDGKTSNENVKSSAASSKKDGGLARTGVCLLAVIGMIAFCAGSAYCLLESKKRSFVQGAYARKTSRGVYMRPQNPDGAKRRVIVVAIAAVLLAGLCFCAFVLKTDALAETTDSMIKCDSSVKIDESGNVVSSGVTVENNSAKVVGIENAVAPTELSGWQATFASHTVPAKSSVSGTWDGTTVPSDILAEVKSNGSATLAFQLEVTYDNEGGKTDTKELDYSLFSLEGGEWVYDKTQKTPEVICTGTLVKDTDYTVVYGENVNAGEGTVTITGIGSYSGSKNFKFTIAKAKLTVSGIKVNSKTYDGTTSATFNYDDISVAGKVAGDTVSATATGAFPSANVGTHALALTLAPSGTDAGNYEIDTTASQASAQGVITQKTVKVSGITASNKTYDGSTNATLDVTGLTWDGIEEGDTLSLVAANVTGAFASKNASDTAQTVTITYGTDALGGTSAANYILATAGEGGSQATATATISKAALTFTWTYAETAPQYDAETHTPTLTVTGAASSETVTPTVTYTKKSEETATSVTPKDAATYVATATISMAEAVNYSLPTNTTTEFTIAKAPVTITWDPTGEAKYAYDGSAHTPTATVGNAVSGESISATLAYKDSSGADLTSAPSAIGTYTATVAALSGATASNYALPATGLAKDFDIFERGGYWLAPAGAENPEASSGIIKPQSQIEEDMEVLRGVREQTSAGKDKTAVSAEYTNYMNGKDAEGNAKEIRLYTRWNGEDAGTGANQWVEFRIIQVGSHDDDGSAVTFMATHSLPTAKQMNDSATNSGGWASSAMRTSVFAEGGYVQAGLSGLKDVAKTINKVAISGSHGSWVEGSTTQDKFWLMSFSELAGENTAPITSYGWYKNEGSQYDWCRTNAVANFMISNVAFAGIDKTRDGSSYPVGYSDAAWWLRAPSGNFSYSFGCVYTDGCPSYYSSASDGLGVVPCFAL